MTATLPSVKAKVANAGEANMTGMISGVAAAISITTRVTRRWYRRRNTCGRGLHRTRTWAGRNIDECAVKIEKHGDAAARPDLSGDARPIRKVLL